MFRVLNLKKTVGTRGAQRAALGFSGLAFACAQASNGDAPATSPQPGPETAGASGEPAVATPAQATSQHNLPAFFSGILFSDNADSEPTTVRVKSSVGSYECPVLFPGSGPWAGSGGGAECAADVELAETSFSVSFDYPFGEFAEREGMPKSGSRSGSPEGVCDSGACSKMAASARPTPEFPHVRLSIGAGTDVENAVLEVVGNGRDFELDLPLRALTEPAMQWYLNVDSPPTTLQ